ncbi:MAG: hypothetical protein K2J95_05225 [Lachnospiraceae bacterium]|nr:hypothetical protein [Lachnospiraceae bacterium]
MKKIMQKTLILAALMIAVVFLVSYIMIGTTEEMILVFELFVLAFTVSVIQYFAERLAFENRFAYVICEYLAISIFVLLYGYFMNWFMKSNWWAAFLYVAMVYIPAYFLDIAIVKRNIDFINKKLEEKRKNENNSK